MRTTTCRLRSLGFLFALLCLPAQAWAWGGTGHEIINQAAANLSNSPASQFLRANSANLVRLATVPDNLWKKPDTYQAERPMHFFQWDAYRTSPIAQGMPMVLGDAMQLVGEQYITKNGSAVWRIGDLYSQLVSAFSAQNWTRAIQLAGVLGHYVGDLSQPMHVTSDYDGQSIHHRGIHAYFETKLVDSLDRNTLETATEQNAGGEYNGSTQDGTSANDAMTIAFQEAQQSFSELPTLLNDFTQTPENDDDLTAQLPPELGHGAANLARIWDMAANASGVQSFPATHLSVPDPEWIPLNP